MPTIFNIGPFRLDTKAGLLFRGTEPIALGQRAVALLQALVERSGAPVAKEALMEAAWPGLAVEESNLAVQIAALRRTFQAAGGEGWIETLPRRGYRFVGPVAAEEGAPAGSSAAPVPTPTLPDLPSIAVLPFENLSGDAEQDYFADGVVEELITALSRFRQLFVIARNSSFTYKGRAVDVRRIGRELGVRYLLQGSVRKAAGRVRIAGQLIDAATATHLWADRFEGALEDIFDLQDQVTTRVIGAIAPKVERAELERSRRKPTESLDAYDFYLRALMPFHRWTKDGIAEALRLFYRAIELDPGFAAAHGMAAWCYVRRKISGWMSDAGEETAEAERLARRAADLAYDDAVALCLSGFALARIANSVEAGGALIARALSLNPNLTTAWFLSGWTKIYDGDPAAAIDHFARALRLNPLDPLSYRMHTGTAAAHFLAGRYDEASLWAEKALGEEPNDASSLRIAAASYALAGRLVEAKKAMARMCALDPAFRMSDFAQVVPFRRKEDIERYKEGLRKAGLPDESVFRSD